MTEPILDYGNAGTDRAWYAWLQAKDDKQLAAYWRYVRDWTPVQDHPSGDPDAMQIKYELTAQLMDERGLHDDGSKR
jgi:nicotinamide mononucleotide adenylyltransferase